MIVVNAYTPVSPGWGAVNDSFPVNTWVGTAEEVLGCVRDLLGNPNAGIARVEIVLDPTHKAYRVGQAPMPLGVLFPFTPTAPGG